MKRIPATLQDVSFELLPGSAFRPSDPASSARCFAPQDGSEFCPRAPDTSSLARGLAESPPSRAFLWQQTGGWRGKRRLESRSKVGRTHGCDPQDFKKLREAVAQCSMPKRRSFWKRQDNAAGYPCWQEDLALHRASSDTQTHHHHNLEA